MRVIRLGCLPVAIAGTLAAMPARAGCHLLQRNHWRPFTGEAEGGDAAAVAKATRAVTEKLKLVCAR
jgi:hypothetical protein